MKIDELRKRGYISSEIAAAAKGAPPREMLAAGPKAVIECYEEIPCNPCVEVCPHGAIRIEGEITGLPVLIAEKCDGCSLCLPACPGMAIFLVDLSSPGTKGIVKLPYEFKPQPSKGGRVIAMDRSGRELGEAVVAGVQNPKKFDRTPIVALEVDKELAMEVRHFRLKRQPPVITAQS